MWPMAIATAAPPWSPWGPQAGGRPAWHASLGIPGSPGTRNAGRASAPGALRNVNHGVRWRLGVSDACYDPSGKFPILPCPIGNAELIWAIASGKLQ